MLNTSDAILETLGVIRGMGIHLAVDDFGTGYSSLGYLKRFPINELKLDQSFVRDLDHDMDDRALASAIIGIGKTLQFTVVAEGVETAAQQRFLVDQGCRVAQGFYYSRPQAPEDLEAWFAHEGARFVPRVSR